MAPYQPVPENGYSPGHAPAYNPGFQPSYDLGPGYEKTQPNVKVDTMETMISVASQKDIVSPPSTPPSSRDGSLPTAPLPAPLAIRH
jgi:hypothetical protein